MAAAEAKDPREKLGKPFWVLWVAGYFVLFGAYAGLLALNFAQEHFSAWLHAAETIVFTLSIWALAMTPYLLRRKRGVGPKLRPPYRRYLLRFFVAIVGYLALLTISIELYDTQKPNGLLAWAIALAPTIPLLFVIRAIVLLMKEEDDEYQRMLHIQAFVWATGLMLAVCTIWGFLETFLLVPHVWAWAVFPLWAVCLVPAQLVTRWKWR